MPPRASTRFPPDALWLTFLVLAGGASSACIATSFFDASVLLSGILCVGLVAIGRREGYLIGLYNSLSYSLLAFTNGLLGEVYLNLLFFIPTGIIGYVMWSRHTRHDGIVAMRRLRGPQRILLAITCLASATGLGFLLGLDRRQNTPFLDATTNSLSIAATLLMMMRYQEQWILYVLLNVVSIVMWIVRFRAGGEGGDLMVLMWSLFLLNALFGYWRWHVGAKAASTSPLRVTTEMGPCDAA